MRFNFIFCFKRKKTTQTIKKPLCFEVIPCNNANTFLLQDNVILLFLYLELLRELFAFHGLSYVMKYKQGICLFLSYANY